MFGFAGFSGLLLAGLFLNFEHYTFNDSYRALTGAIAGALGPYLAYLFAKHWFQLGPGLKGLSAQRLLVVGALCGTMSPVFHHAFIWVKTGTLDQKALIAMIVGDIVGILIILYVAKAVISHVDRLYGERPRVS